jgi:hypothetical protein
MLPGLRFLLGATLAAALMGVVTLGLVTTVRLSRQAAIGPLERSFAYAEPKRWSQSTDPELTRIFDAVARSSRTAAARAGEYDTSMRVPTPASTASNQHVLPTPWSKEPPWAAVLPDLALGAPLSGQPPPPAAQPAPLLAALPQERMTETAAAQTTASEVFEVPNAGAAAAAAEAKPPEITSEPSLNDSADQLASLPASIVTLGAVEEREIAEPEAEPVNVLPRPRPMSPRMLHIPLVRAKAHAVRKVRPKAKPNATPAQAAQRWPTASSGYQPAPPYQPNPQHSTAPQRTPPQRTSPQQPPGWGWGFQ